METNNYPEGFNEDGKLVWTTRPRKLKVGEKVEYELVGIKTNLLDPTGKTKTIPFKKGIKKRDNIFIPYPKEALSKLREEGINDEGEFIDIEYGSRTENIFFTKADGGSHTIVGGTSQAQKRFEYMETCNLNESNPNRSKEVSPVFRLVDHKSKAKEERKLRREREEATQKAKNLKKNELLRIALGYGERNPELIDDDVLRNKIEGYAEANPLEFLIKSENTDYIIHDVALKAKKKGIIGVDMQKRAITGSNGETLHTWSPEKNVNWPEKFVDFVKSKEGEEFYKALKEQMKIND